jgi:hypothetical protein
MGWVLLATAGVAKIPDGSEGHVGNIHTYIIGWLDRFAKRSGEQAQGGVIEYVYIAL